MKKLTLLFVFLLASCATFIPPIKHDPAQAELYIKFKDYYEDLACNSREENRAYWNKAIERAHRLYLYTEYREDPQTENTKQIESSLFNAFQGREAYCEAKLKLVGIQMDILEKAWKGRE